MSNFTAIALIGKSYENHLLPESNFKLSHARIKHSS